MAAGLGLASMGLVFSRNSWEFKREPCIFFATGLQFQAGERTDGRVKSCLSSYEGFRFSDSEKVLVFTGLLRAVKVRHGQGSTYIDMDRIATLLVRDADFEPRFKARALIEAEPSQQAFLFERFGELLDFASSNEASNLKSTLSWIDGESLDGEATEAFSKLLGLK